MATSDHHAFPLPGRGNKFFNHLQETATSKATPSLKDIKPLIDEVLTYLETATTTDVMTKAVADALFTLEQIPGFLMNESFSTIVEIDTTKLTFIQHKVGQYLLQNGFAKITVTIARSLQDTASYITGTQLQAQCQYNLYLLYMLVLRYTHVYPVTDASFCSSICKEGILDTLKLSLIYLNDTANKLPLYLDGYNLLIRTTIVVLGVLFNCIAFCSENKYLYRQAKIVDTLSTITRVDNDINLLVLLTVAYVVEEAESNDMLLNSQYTIQYVIELLKKAVYSANHFVVTKSGIFASSSRHLLHGLNYLALNNDVNKRIILKYGGLPAIIRMLQPIFSEEEIQLATKTLRSLAGVDTIRKEIEGQLHKSGKYNDPLRIFMHGILDV